MMTYEIKFEDVSFQYNSGESPALKNINLTFSPGEIVLITGPSGSGKTTLCSCINGLIPHFHEGTLSGKVSVGDYDTKRARIGGLASLVGMVFQDPESQLVTNSVADEIAFGPENFGVPREEINLRVLEALKATRLEGYSDREPHNLSGGEQQACVIAATYAMQPEIYVMDEPLANLDPVGRVQVMNLVIDVAKQRGKTLVIVEHSLEEVLPLVDRVIIMDKGEVVRDGSVADILKAGDIKKVFLRPSLVRLSEAFHLSSLMPTPDTFCKELNSQYVLTPQSVMARREVPADGRRPVIEMEHVYHAYNEERMILKDVSFKICEGEFVAIMGRNGSGKTTLVRHIIGLNHPKKGKVTVMGNDVSQTPTHILAQDVGFCFQNPNHQLVSFNVRDEMLFGLKAHQVDPAEFEARIHAALEIVGMVDQIATEIFDLGKGQKQRLALASVLTLKPTILVIDEPTTGQDPEMTNEIFAIIKHLNELGTTVVMITHNVNSAAEFAKRAIVIHHGEISFDGNINDLITDPELMHLNSLELPDTTKVASMLSPYGIAPWLVTFDDLSSSIHQLLEVSHGN